VYVQKLFTFEPVIAKHSRQLVNRRRQRAHSTGRMHAAEVGIVQAVNQEVKDRNERLMQLQQQYAQSQTLSQAPSQAHSQAHSQAQSQTQRSQRSQRHSQASDDDGGDVDGLDNLLMTGPPNINNNNLVDASDSHSVNSLPQANTQSPWASLPRGRSLTRAYSSNDVGPNSHALTRRSASPTTSAISAQASSLQAQSQSLSLSQAPSFRLTRSMSADRLSGSARGALSSSRSPSPRRAKQWVMREERSLSKSK
jgi:hypothetical protein